MRAYLDKTDVDDTSDTDTNNNCQDVSEDGIHGRRGKLEVEDWENPPLVKQLLSLREGLFPTKLD